MAGRTGFAGRMRREVVGLLTRSGESGARRRPRLPGGDKRTEKLPMVRCTEAEMLTIERAARLRGMAVAAFVGDCAVRTAEGRLRPARRPQDQSTPAVREAGGDVEHLVEPLKELLRELFAERRQLVGAFTNLNQLAAAANSGNPAAEEQIAATLTHVTARLDAHDQLEHRVSDLIGELT